MKYGTPIIKDPLSAIARREYNTRHPCGYHPLKTTDPDYWREQYFKRMESYGNAIGVRMALGMSREDAEAECAYMQPVMKDYITKSINNSNKNKL